MEFHEAANIFPLMTIGEARQYVDEIKRQLESMRMLVYDLWRREGWRVLGYANWTECVENEFPSSSRHIWHELSAAKIETNLLNPGSVGSIPERQLRPLTSLEPEQQREAWSRVVETAPNGKITAAHVQSVVDRMIDKPVHVSHNSGEEEWYTPPEYIEAARRVMGTIDLDPASSEEANKIVKANIYFTKDDDGLRHHWSGNVWMNPPYSSGIVDKFTGKITAHYAHGDINQAIVLVNNATETEWFQNMLTQASAICLVRKRIKFIKPTGEGNKSPLQGQVILYMGKDISLFEESFRNFGRILYVQ